MIMKDWQADQSNDGDPSSALLNCPSGSRMRQKVLKNERVD